MAQPHGFQQLPRQLHRLRAAAFFMGDRRFNQVIQHRHMGKQVEVLEHIADVDALTQNRLLLQFIQAVAAPLVADVIAVDLNKALVDPLQMVDGAQQGRFARSRRPEDHRYRTRWQLQRHAIQRLVFAKPLADAGNDDLSLRRLQAVINGFGHDRAPVYQ